MNNKLFKFKITRELYVILFSWILVVSSLYTAFKIFTTKRVALNFITFGFGTILIFGIAVPLIYTRIIKGEKIARIGITRKRLGLSLLLGMALTVIQYKLTFGELRIPEIKQLIPLVTMVLAVSMFENIYFRGFVQLKLEEHFGIVPSVILASIIYSLYHIGYGMTWVEMYTLFYVGLFYAVVFRFTKNIFVLYPFLTPSGALYTNMKEGLVLPFEATYGFIIIITLSIVAITSMNKINIKVLNKKNNY